MPNQVMFMSGVELVLIFGTSFLLLQPKPAFRARASKAAKWARVIGVLLLLVTFFWSVVLGAILALNDMSIRI